MKEPSRSPGPKSPAPAERLEAWVTSYQPVVYRAACLILRDPAAAEDVAQETFLRALRAADRIDPGTNVGPWLYRIAVNVALNQLRSRRRAERNVRRLAGEEPSGEDIAERNATRSAVGQGLRRLPDRLRVR